MRTKLGRTLYVLSTVVWYAFKLSSSSKDAQRWLFTRFYALGGIYTKFLQLLALQEEHLSTEFSNLKDALAVFDNAKIERIDVSQLLRIELGKKADRLQLSSPEPFAAGSFAQVYDATFDSHIPVVIKVLRPSVSRTLQFDLNLLGIVARLVSAITPQGMIDFVGVVRDFRDMTLNETNYLKEVKNAQHLKDALQQNPVIYIPETYDEVSTEHLIVQEKISGMPLTRLLSEDITDKPSYTWHNYGTNLNYVMEVLATELIGGSLSHGGTYGDPHPGNIYILPSNRVALIDFGIGVSEHQNKAGFIRLLNEYSALYNYSFQPANFSQAMLYYFAPDLTQSLQTVSTYFNKQELVNKVLGDISRTVERTIQQRANDSTVNNLIKQYRMMALLTQVVNKRNRFGLTLSIEQPEFLRSAHIFLSVIHLLGCDKRLLGNAFYRVAQAHQHLITPSEPSYDSESIDRSLYHIANWFERLQQSDPKLYSKLMNTWSNA